MLVGGVAMYRVASIEVNQMQEARLEQLGATIQTLIQEHMADFRAGSMPVVPHLKTRATAALLYRYQVWSRHGSLLLRSHEAPASRPITDYTKFGYTTTRMDGDDYRVFSLPTEDGEFVIQVAENLNEAWSNVPLTAAYYAAFLLVPFGVVLWATLILVRRALHSINTLADSLRARNPLDVSPIPVDAPPQELVPILVALDMLFGRMRQALSVERTFVSLAAHEMRTPLAGLRAQAQVLTMAGLTEEPLAMAATLIKGVDRASHLLDQLLDLARVEGLAMSGEVPMQRVRVADVCDEVTADLSLQIERKQVSVSTAFDEETVWCHAFALKVLVRNLVTNAVLYAPAGGRVELRSATEDATVVLSVDDSGPGIAAKDRERAFERFNRLGRNQANGVGLGLSIVLSVVDMHRARIQLDDSPLGGLRVRVLLPQLRTVEPTPRVEGEGKDF